MITDGCYEGILVFKCGGVEATNYVFIPLVHKKWQLLILVIWELIECYGSLYLKVNRLVLTNLAHTNVDGRF